MKSTAEIIDEIERERQKRYIAAVITYGYLKKLKKRFNGKKPPTIEVCRELMAETVNKTDPKL